LIGNRGSVTSAMKHANDDQFTIGWQVIDCVGGVKDDAQPWTKLLAP